MLSGCRRRVIIMKDPSHRLGPVWVEQPEEVIVTGCVNEHNGYRAFRRRTGHGSNHRQRCSLDSIRTLMKVRG